MSKLTGSKKTAPDSGDQAPRLTDRDIADLADLERVIETGVRAMGAVEAAGRALAIVRDRQLYRGSNESFEGYVVMRFNLTSRRARQMMSFAAITDDLEAVSRDLGTAVPSVSEKAARPLTGLDRDDRQAAIVEAAASPAGLTAASIATAAARRKKKPNRRALPKPRRLLVPGGVVVVTHNRRGVTLGASVRDLLVAALKAIDTQAADRDAA